MSLLTSAALPLGLTRGPCPVCSTPDCACTDGVEVVVGNGVTITRARPVEGQQVAQERIYAHGPNDSLILVYTVGDVISDEDAERWGIVDGRLAPDLEAVDPKVKAPTEKPRKVPKAKRDRKKQPAKRSAAKKKAGQSPQDKEDF